MALVVFGSAACEDEDKVVSPIDDTTPPSVTITSVSHTAESLTVNVKADDYISVAMVISEVCCDIVASDTFFTVGRTETATLRAEYFFPAVTQNTPVTITGIGIDSSGNQAQRTTPYIITP
ncbi:MAG: hypothetical protein PVI01_02790 [Gemmatimonadales bacterium]|jgi:hypothetical protein